MNKKKLIMIFFIIFITSAVYGEIVYVEPYTLNASKGDILFQGMPDEFIGETLNAGFGGYWAHSGMMIDDGHHIRHNTMEVEMLRINKNWIGVPTGLNADDLEHGPPGLITEKTQWLESTDVVLKPLDSQEEDLRPILEEIADKHKWLKSYYRINSYINPSVEDWISQFNTTNILTPHKGAHCSGQLWYANYLSGKRMNVCYATPDMVDAGADALYNGLYELILEEVKNQGGFWGNLFNTLKFINYKKIADKIANQVVNAFGLDIYDDTNPTWRNYLGKTHTYSVAPDHLMTTSMINPLGNKTGLQTSDSSYYLKIENTAKGGGYYIDTETGNPAGPGERIKYLYRDILLKNPDQNGLDYWTNKVNQGEIGLRGVAKNFFHGNEYQEFSAEEKATSFYKLILGRHPDQEGLNHYAGVINNHTKSLYNVAAELSSSNEFNGKDYHHKNYITTTLDVPNILKTNIVTIYKNANFSGNSLSYHGTQSYSSLEMNDAISSIKVKTGYKLTLYQHSNFQGQQWSYYCDNSLVPWNDTASSLKIEKSKPPVVCIFKDSNYREIPVCYFGETSDADLSNDIGNDNVSSVRVFDSNYMIVLYQDNNFGGSTVTYSSDSPNLSGFNDKASSIKVLLKR